MCLIIIIQSAKVLKVRYNPYYISCYLGCQQSFAANKNFCKKMRKFSFVFCKRFCEIQHFLRKLFRQKNTKKMRTFARIISRKQQVQQLQQLIAQKIRTALRAQHLQFYYIIIKNFSSVFFFVKFSHLKMVTFKQIGKYP